MATSGAPQGSILGPLCLNLYINDIENKLTVDHLLCADDLTIFKIINNQSDCISLQRALDEIQNRYTKIGF